MRTSAPGGLAPPEPKVCELDGAPKFPFYVKSFSKTSMLCNLQSMENVRRGGILWLALVLGASAVTWHVGPPSVPPGGDGSLALPFDSIQVGLDAAAPGDEVLVQPGTYTGAGNYDLNFNGKAVTLRAAGGPSNTVIDAANAGRAVNLLSGETTGTVIRGFTITGVGTSPSWESGTTNDPVYEAGFGAVGTAIWGAPGAGATIEECWFVGNRAYTGLTVTITDWGGPLYERDAVAGGSGGAIAVENGELVVSRCRFVSNSAGYWGGAIWARGGRVRVDESEFEHNSAAVSNRYTMTRIGWFGDPYFEQRDEWRTEGGGGAVAIWDAVEVVFTNCAWIANEASGPGGAGLLVSNASVRLVASEIARNAAIGGGGGFWIEAAVSGVVVSACDIYSNEVPYAVTNVMVMTTVFGPASYEGSIIRSGSARGGGLFIAHAADVMLDGLIVAGNGAEGTGGGVDARGISSLVVTGCVFSGNVSRDAGGGLYATEVAGAARVVNSEFLGNGAGDGGTNELSVIELGMIGWPYYFYGFQQRLSGLGGGAAFQACNEVEVRDGLFDGQTVGGRGGGVAFDGVATGVISRVLFASNAAHHEGGGALLRGGGANCELSDSAFRSNRVADAFQQRQVLTIGAPESLFYQSTETRSFSGAGGGLLVDGAAVEIRSCAFSGNRGAVGGALAATGGARVVGADWRMRGNTARGSSLEDLQQIRIADDVRREASFALSAGRGAALFIAGATVAVDRAVMVTNTGGVEDATVALEEGATWGATNVVMADNRAAPTVWSRLDTNEVSGASRVWPSVYGVAGATVVGIGDGAAAEWAHVTIAWNRVAGTGATVRVVGEGLLDVVNSVVWSNGIHADDPDRVAARYSAIDGGVTGVALIAGNPRVTPDGRLLSDSVCRGAGDPGAGVALDFEGEWRAGPDIGADEFVDTDHDGLGDWWELIFFGNLAQGGAGDPDGDGASNVVEYERGLDPTRADSDGDGIPDGWEWARGLDPLWMSAGEDPDADTYFNLDEYIADTDPFDAESVLKFGGADASSGLFFWHGAAGRRYVIESAVGDGLWSPLATVDGSGGVLVFTNALYPTTTWLRLTVRLAP